MGERHSDLVGGSTVKRFMNCPGASELSTKYPNEASSYAQEGTDLHTAMEMIFENDVSPAELLGEAVGDIVAITREQVDALQWCYERVDKIIGGNEFALETWGDFPALEGAGGTADVTVFHKDGTLEIADYKFGRGVPVSAENNPQLLFYGLCMAQRFGMQGFTRIRGHILQPRLDSHTSYEWTRDEALAFAADVREAAKNQRPSYSIGDWCQFCRAKPGCPAQRAKAERAHAWRSVAREDLPKALSMVEDLEAWCADVRKAAHKALEAGETVQGWKLVQKRGQRVWKGSVAAVEKALWRRGLTVKQYRNTTLISPAQAEKLVGAEAIRTMVEAKTGKGTTLARESDKRPAVSTGRSLNQLANALSSTLKTEESNE